MDFHSNLFASGNIPRSRSFEQGKYGRLFPGLPPFAPDTDEMRKKLRALSAENRFAEEGASALPAGYTYLGQFIAHDVTFDLTSIAQRQVDPEQLWNFRTPALDLDSVYGGGPFAHPIFYESGDRSVRTKFRVEHNDWHDRKFFDLPRVVDVDVKTGKIARKEAIIPDPRNDENLIISQMHLAFLKLHNSFYDKELAALKLKDDQLDRNQKTEQFLRAQQATRWHYQWVILHDYLPRIVGKDLVEKVKKDEAGKVRRQYFDWRNEAFIPLEFSAAAFRFGHSQVRGSYTLNNDHPDFSILKPTEHPGAPETYVDWSFFFNEERVNRSRFVNTILSNQLNPLPGVAVTTELEQNLAYRNLVKGLMLELPSGQSIAKAMGYNDDSHLLVQGNGIPPAFERNTPLWFFILYEAEKKQKEAAGEKKIAERKAERRGIVKRQENKIDSGILGPVGGRIVAEVLVGLLESDKNSFLYQDPNWKPEKVRNNEQEKYTMKDLLTDAGVYNGALI